MNQVSGSGRRHRQRLGQRGLKRVELEVPESDVALIREFAKMFRKDGESAEWIRGQLATLVASKGRGLKALLVAAPLEGIRIACPGDRGRKIEL